MNMLLPTDAKLDELYFLKRHDIMQISVSLGHALCVNLG